MDFACILSNYFLSATVLGWLPCQHLRPFIISALSCNKLIFGSDWLCYGHVNLMFRNYCKYLSDCSCYQRYGFGCFTYQLNSTETFSLIYQCGNVAVLYWYFFRYGWLISTTFSITLCPQTAYLTKTCFCMLKHKHPC